MKRRDGCREGLQNSCARVGKVQIYSEFGAICLAANGSLSNNLSEFTGTFAGLAVLRGRHYLT
ncbi:MAG: hypothetical protein MUC93_13120, partial [Bacteroidales bacterium]|nr:hypothetical protein [Bacteroidales bacterium]